MSTIHRPRAAEPGETALEQLPPLTVVTDGIPASEHLPPRGSSVARGAVLVETTRPRATATGDGVGRAYRLGVIALLVLVLTSFGYGVRSLLEPAPTGARMGLSEAAWSDYRSGEREPAPATATRAVTPFLPASPFAAR